jgi:hypothetical protein
MAILTFVLLPLVASAQEREGAKLEPQASITTVSASTEAQTAPVPARPSTETLAPPVPAPSSLGTQAQPAPATASPDTQTAPGAAPPVTQTPSTTETVTPEPQTQPGAGEAPSSVEAPPASENREAAEPQHREKPRCDEAMKERWMERMREMKAKGDEAEKDISDMDARLAGKLAAIKTAKGADRKIAALEAVVNELVAQRRDLAEKVVLVAKAKRCEAIMQKMSENKDKFDCPMLKRKMSSEGAKDVAEPKDEGSK